MIKKSIVPFLLTLATFALIVLVAGCTSDSTPVKQVPIDTGNRFNGISADEIDIITDSQTGCKYVFVDKGGGNYETTALSPLMKKNGLADCPDNTGAIK